MKKTKSYPVYRFIKWLVWLFYPKITVEGLENLPQEPSLIVANHAQMHGPIACELYFPGRRRTWCAGQMMERKEVSAYAYQDFWSAKPRWQRPFWKLLSHMIAPLCACVFNNADTIGVYRDSRIIATFKNTVKVLQGGEHVVIFPEKDVPHNQILWQFQENFVDIARLYYKRTGKALHFVPMYIAPDLKKMYIDKAIVYDYDNPNEAERGRICAYLADTITNRAQSLPEHRVVPYPNMPKRDYPSNLPQEVGTQ